MEQVNFETDGGGYWSDVAKDVRIVDIQCSYDPDYKEFGELLVYFDTKDWDVNVDGLIYTDKLFMSYLRNFCTEQGLGTDVSYSEQGMQGDDYVSCDVGADFIKRWEAKFGILTV